MSCTSFKALRHWASYTHIEQIQREPPRNAVNPKRVYQPDLFGRIPGSVMVKHNVEWWKEKGWPDAGQGD